MDHQSSTTPHADPSGESASIAPATPSKFSRVLTRLIGRNRQLVYLAWGVVLVAWAATLPIAWLCWWIGMRELWHWVGGNLLRGAAAALGSLFLFAGPVWGWMAALGFTQAVADATLTGDAATLADARARVRETEDDALDRFEATDEAKLLPLLRYSRAQLDAYYAMGLAQTRRSFVNAAIAMWLGFLILIAGILLYIAPLEQIGIARPRGDFNTLILASALIVEVISALFLWVYRSTIGQLTFYYRLQMQSHTAILSFRIASTMDKADDAKRAIIDKLLGASLVPERPTLRGARGLGVPHLPGGD